MEIPNNFKNRVLSALFVARNNYTGVDSAFAKTVELNVSVFNRIKKGESTDGLISPAKWLRMGRILGVKLDDDKWVIAKTAVFNKIENDLKSCKEHSISLLFVDECEIGKTGSAIPIIQTIQNCFYVDCSQAKTKQMFIRLIARTVGVESTGRFYDVKNDLKYALTNMEKPVVVLDEAGDLEYNAFLEIKELWNATEGHCGWYMMGADGLMEKFMRGIRNKKVGYRETFSRFNNKCMSIVPAGPEARKDFYAEMISEVLVANLPQDKHYLINDLVPQILGKDSMFLGCLRRTRTFVKLIKSEHEASVNA